MQSRVAIIHPFFGVVPPWWNVYIESVKKNRDFDFLYITDLVLPKCDASNITVIKCSLSEIEILAGNGLGFSVKLHSSYKMCDLKPAYGLIFKDFIKEYDFWGFADIDLIYGNINSFIKKEFYKKFDVITCRRDCIAGQFTILKNKPFINRICQSIPNYKKIVNSEEPCYSDELDFRDQILNFSQQGLLKPYFEENLADDILAESRGRKALFFKFDEGRIIDCITSQERFLFHFQKSKKKSEFLDSIAIIDDCDGLYFINDRFEILNYWKFLLKIVQVCLIDSPWILKRMIKIHFLKQDPSFL